MNASYEDVYFDEDAIYMERNSRDFRRRTPVIDENTEAICDFLRSHSIAGGVPSAVIKEVFYPKWMTRDKYEYCRIKSTRFGVGLHDASGRDGGFGGLFSLTFTTATASRTFFDTLSCLKGPSLGTNFTLACPYTILAHYTELEWAAEYGVEESLIRVSVGMEEKGVLLHCFEAALKAAEGTSES
jgi:cystathionine gamma-synthase